MTLTSLAFLAVVAALFVGGLVLAAALLPRSRRSVTGFLARVGALLAVSVLALLVTAVALNDSFVFYASWGDLLGGGDVVAQTDHAGGTAARAVAAPVGGPGLQATRPASLPPLPRPGQRVQTYTFKGAHSGLTGRVVVLLPADYEAPAQAAHSYPVIEAFHGSPGNPEIWDQAFPVLPAIDARVAAHRLAQPIVVAPQLEFPGGTDTECVNGGAGQPQVETWVARDVPELVVKALRVRTDRASWSTIGYSSGGWCAAMATMLHPDVFGSGIVLGGYFAPDFGARYRPFTATSTEGQRYDLVSRAQQQPPPVALWVETSKADTLSWQSSAAIVAHAAKPLSVQSDVLTGAGHRASVWVDVLPQALDWLGSTAPGFAPS